jgi:hypothetical protein
MGKRKAPPDTSHFTWVEDHVAAASLAYKQDTISDINDEIKLNDEWHFLKTIDGSTGVRLKLWVSKKNGNVLVGFRGTSSLAEAKLDADIALDGFNTEKGEGRGNVHRGFNKGFQDVRGQMENEIRLLRDMGYLPKGAVLQFAGHSLGGALSDLASTYFAGMFPELQVVTTTIGAPTPGDKDFGDYSRSLPNLNRTRIVAQGDPVANIKIPGMDHIEKQNVIDFRMRKNGKSTNLWESFKEMTKEAAIGVASIGSLGAAAAIAANRGKNNHSLDNYQKVLLEDFKENRVKNVNEALERDIDANEEAYQQSKTSETSMPSGCECECHLHDRALDQNEMPPTSLGSVEKMAPAQTETTMMTTAPLQNVDVLNAFGQTVQQSLNMTQLKEQADVQQAQSTMEADEVMEQINVELEAQKEKEKKTLLKLQEQYAQLTNQTEDDMDVISKERSTFQKNRDDIQYLQERIQFELEHPEYVPDDDYGSKDQAVQFKNRLNRLYKMILRASSKRQVELKTTPEPSEDKIERELVNDQSEQIEGAQSTNQLNPDDQTGDFVFDVSKLSDLDTNGPETEKQLVEWLNYPDMTTRDLFDVLKNNMTSQYKQQRMEALRNKEQDKRKTAAESIKSQLDNYHTAGGTGKNDVLNQKRQTFFRNLSQNKQFQAMVKQNQINVKTLTSKYQKEGDDISIMNDLFGYDERTIQDSLGQKYQEQLLNVSTDIPAEQRKQMMDDVWKTYQVNLAYPWVASDKFGGIYQQYKNDPSRLMEEVNKLKPSIPSQYTTDPDADTSGYKPELFQKNVQDLANNTKEIVNEEIKDYYKEFKTQQEGAFQDAQKVQDMFKQWNPEGSFVQKAASELKDAMTFYTSRKGGWYDRQGRYLGAAASPDFQDYARNHPELGYRYLAPESNEVIDTLWELGGSAISMRYGINPTALIDNIAGEGDQNGGNSSVKDPYAEAEYKQNLNDDFGDIFNPYAFMGMGGGSGKTTSQPQKGTAKPPPRAVAGRK